ncbi:hypothetical protein B4V02_10610 [Paenibacillus kribbensis]|uniref:Uncharacterized protein n=1 Tax=Paenibacillus kribbensis TaxID=172713 RepID=A0A222WLU7_9BACL|nr:hypothetical protein B4V02_10610 [Paenibacillus kribbensis]
MTRPSSSVHTTDALAGSILPRLYHIQAYKKNVYRRTFTEVRMRLAEAFLAIIELFGSAEQFYNLQKNLTAATVRLVIMILN